MSEDAARTPRTSLLGRISTPLKQAASYLGGFARGGTSSGPSPEQESGEPLMLCAIALIPHNQHANQPPGPPQLRPRVRAMVICRRPGRLRPPFAR
jgi:hypothetical protein